MADGACCARSFGGGSDPRVERFSDLLVTTGLAQFFALSRSWSLRWGLSGQFGPNPNGYRARTTILATDLYLRFRPTGSTKRSAVSLTSEWMVRGRQAPRRSIRDWGTTTSLIWDISPTWQVGGRVEWVAGAPDDPLAPEWDAARTRVSLQATARPSHFSRFRLQGSYDRPMWRSEPILGAILAAEFLIGAHGEHAY